MIGHAVVLTGYDGVMMKSLLVNLFSEKTASDNFKIAVIAGTSAINYFKTVPLLHFCEGFLKNFNKLVQLMGQLNRGNTTRFK